MRGRGGEEEISAGMVTTLAFGTSSRFVYSSATLSLYHCCETNNRGAQSAKPECSAKKFHQQIVARIAFTGKINNGGATFYKTNIPPGRVVEEESAVRRRNKCRPPGAIYYHLNGLNEDDFVYLRASGWFWWIGRVAVGLLGVFIII